jgi:transcriptional regulator with XRE-family HTH domain
MVASEAIKQRIKERGLSQGDVAAKLHLAQCTISQKINNIRPLSLDEAFLLADLLQITSEEFCKYFFAPEVA